MQKDSNIVQPAPPSISPTTPAVAQPKRLIVALVLSSVVVWSVIGYWALKPTPEDLADGLQLFESRMQECVQQLIKMHDKKARKICEGYLQDAKPLREHPRTQARAQQLTAEIEDALAYDELFTARVLHPNTAARDAAVARWLAIPSLDKDVDRVDFVLRSAHNAGAYEAFLDRAHDLEGRTSALKERTLAVSEMLADVNHLQRATHDTTYGWKVLDESRIHFTDDALDRKRASLLCLMGEREAGFQILQALAQQDQLENRPNAENLYSAIVCKPASPDFQTLNTLNKQISPLLALYDDPQALVLVSIGVFASHEMLGSNPLASRLARAALLVLGGQVPMEAVTFVIFDKGYISDPEVLEIGELADYSVFDALTHHADAYRAAADRYAALAEDAGFHGRLCEAKQPWHEVVKPWVCAQPKDALMRINYAFRALAALTFADMSKPKLALAQLALIPPDDGVFRAQARAQLLFELGDTAGAIALLDAWAQGSGFASRSLDQRIMTHLVFAVILGSNGEAERAFTHAEAAHKLALEFKATPLVEPNEHLKDLREKQHKELQAQIKTDADWVLAATAYQAKRDVSAVDLGDAKAWLTLANASPAERPSLRMAKYVADPPASIAGIAAMYLISQGASDADPEAWLDQAVGGEVWRSFRQYQRRRAEAARWRGDLDAERVWREREQRLGALIKDGPSYMLATIADL